MASQGTRRSFLAALPLCRFVLAFLLVVRVAAAEQKERVDREEHPLAAGSVTSAHSLSLGKPPGPRTDVADLRRVRTQGILPWRIASESAEVARVRGDWTAYSRYIETVFAAIGNYPNVVWAQARVAARLGNDRRALERLTVYAAMGITRDPWGDSAFLRFRDSLSWQRVATRLAENAVQPVRSNIYASLRDPEFVPEGIVSDAKTGRIFVSSIKRGVIAVVAKDGSLSDFIRLKEAGLWAAYGMAIDVARRRLWVGSQQIREYDGYQVADSGRSAVGGFDLDRGTLLQTFEAPRDGKPHSFGDLGVLADGSVVVSDAEGGGVYIAREGARELKPLVQPGEIVSPQGIAPSADGRSIYVADYVLGPVRVELASGRVTRLAHADSIAISGVDGMIRSGRSLIGVQNGTRPKRVMRFDLDAAGLRILHAQALEANAEFLGETTHLVLRGDTLLFLANTGFDLLQTADPKKNSPAFTPARIAIAPLMPPGGSPR